MKWTFKASILFLTLIVSLTSCGIQPTAIPATPVSTAQLPTRIVATVPVIFNEPDCTNEFLYLDDVNFSDGTEVSAGQKFLKEWEVSNYGTCNWVNGYKLRFISGDQMGAPDAVSIPEVEVGKKGKFSVEFTAPAEPGTYRSTWKAYSDTNRSFGESIYVEIVVK